MDETQRERLKGWNQRIVICSCILILLVGLGYLGIFVNPVNVLVIILKVLFLGLIAIFWLIIFLVLIETIGRRARRLRKWKRQPIT